MISTDGISAGLLRIGYARTSGTQIVMYRGAKRAGYPGNFPGWSRIIGERFSSNDQYTLFYKTTKRGETGSL